VTDPYDLFAAYYDAVNEEPEERIALLLSLLERHHPRAASVLELGCGTGAVLAGMGSGLDLVGVDRSAAMLDVATRRLPKARFHRGDMTTIDLGRTFDVVLCVCDTINHVTTSAGWRTVFERAANHLSPDGLFIVDFTTRSHFLDLAASTPWAHDVGPHTLVMSVDFNDPLATWHLRLFEALDDGLFRSREGHIDELSLATADVLSMAEEFFEVIETSDTDGGVATDDSPRGVIVGRRI